MSYLLTTLTKKQEVDAIIRDTLDKVLVLRFGRASDLQCLQLDDILAKSSREVSKFSTIALVDIDSEEIQLNLVLLGCVACLWCCEAPLTMVVWRTVRILPNPNGFRTPDHTKWIGSFQRKQDFIDVVEAIFRGAMKGKLIVNCPLPPERIPKFQLLFNNITGREGLKVKFSYSLVLHWQKPCYYSGVSTSSLCAFWLRYVAAHPRKNSQPEYLIKGTNRLRSGKWEQEEGVRVNIQQWMTRLLFESCLREIIASLADFVPRLYLIQLIPWSRLQAMLRPCIELARFDNRSEYHLFGSNIKNNAAKDI
ncbi:hypothetical protein ACLOJK_010795 [Asimina triloba]